MAYCNFKASDVSHEHFEKSNMNTTVGAQKLRECLGLGSSLRYDELGTVNKRSGKVVHIYKHNSLSFTKRWQGLNSRNEGIKAPQRL
jgi:hypothetical protein